MINRVMFVGLTIGLTIVGLAFAAEAQAKGEAQKRWELMNQIREEKFDLIMPEVMRENGVDMWITVNREGFEDPLTEDFGKGYVGSYGYYIFTDRGNGRIERAVLVRDRQRSQPRGHENLEPGRPREQPHHVLVEN